MTFEEAKSFADAYKIDYIETSAKNYDEVESAFWMIGEKVLGKI